MEEFIIACGMQEETPFVNVKTQKLSYYTDYFQ